jgi:hypothetical protein
MCSIFIIWCRTLRYTIVLARLLISLPLSLPLHLLSYYSFRSISMTQTVTDTQCSVGHATTVTKHYWSTCSATIALWVCHRVDHMGDKGQIIVGVIFIIGDLSILSQFHTREYLTICTERQCTGVRHRMHGKFVRSLSRANVNCALLKYQSCLLGKIMEHGMVGK